MAHSLNPINVDVGGGCVASEVRQAIGRADLIIDGMLGIGGSGGLREPYATLAHLAAGERSATTVAASKARRRSSARS